MGDGALGFYGDWNWVERWAMGRETTRYGKRKEIGIGFFF